MYRNCCIWALFLKKVDFTEGLRKIDNGAFSHCKSLGKGKRITNRRRFNTVTLPSTLIEIGEGAFRACHFFGEIVLNEGLQKIGDCAFNSCVVLETITIPSTVTELGNFAFAYSTRLKDVLIHEGIQKIGPKAFLGVEKIYISYHFNSLGNHYSGWSKPS